MSMHELFQNLPMHNQVTHESRILRQTRLRAEIVGLTRIYIRQLLPHSSRYYNIWRLFAIFPSRSLII